MNRIEDQSFLDGGGEMAERIRRKDWSRTPLGPIDDWSPALRMTISIVLKIGFPCIFYWGEKLTGIYNDAYRPLLGEKPEALGHSPLEIWGEAADVIAPFIDKALAGETCRFRQTPFTLLRHRYPEKAWFDWSYSPLRDEHGSIVGFLNLAIETSDQVLAERRRSYLLELGDCLDDRVEPRELVSCATRLLGEFLEADRVGYAEPDSDNHDRWLLHGEWHTESISSMGDAFSLSDFGGEVLKSLREGIVFRADDMSGHVHATASTNGAAFYVPVMVDGHLAAILLVHQAFARHWKDEEVAVVRETAGRTWSAIQRSRAERALTESEQRFRSLADSMPQLVWTADPDGAVTYYNSRIEALGGIRRDDTGSWDWKTILHPDDRAAAVVSWRHSIETGEDYEIEQRVCVADGTYRWFLSRAVPVRVGGQIIAWYGTATDIDDHKKAEEALRRTEAQRSALIAHAPIGMYLADAELCLKEINARALTVFRFIDQPIGMPIGDALRALWPEDVAEDATRRFRETLATGESYKAPTFSGALRGSGEEPRFYEWEIHRVVLPDGGHGVVCYFMDVSDHVVAQHRLRESEERFRAMTDGLPLLVWVHNIQGRQEFVNQAFCEFFGVTRKGLREDWKVPMHPEDANEYTREFLRCVRERRPFHAEVRVSNAEGEWRRLESWGRSHYSPAGKYLGFIGTSADITDRACAEEALRRSEQDLRRLSETLEHRVEERTSELQEQTNLLRKLAAELASTEQRERKRLAALLHDELQQFLVAAGMQMATIGRHVTGEAGERAVERATLWIGEASEAARDLTRQLRPPALYEGGLVAALHWLASEMKERHQVHVLIAEERLSRQLNDDVKALLFECVRELLLNVAKYASVDEAEVKIWEENGFLRLRVADEGCGFIVGEVSAHRQSGGFGLFSIRERLAALGGRLTIDSLPGRGTKVELTVPLGERDVYSETEPFDGAGSREKGRVMISGDPRTRVLVVDDHAMVREGIATLLNGDPRLLVVGEASDGCEALKCVRDQLPDVVLMDLNMPRMNGIEATREIRRAWPTVSVIGLSVQNDDATARAMLEAGAKAFLPKAGETEEMIATIVKLRIG